MKIHFISLLILGIVVTCVSAHAQTRIIPFNSNLQYQVRINFSTASLIFIWPGIFVKMKFTDTAVALNSTSFMRIVKI